MEDDTVTEGRYSSFYFAKNYASKEGSDNRAQIAAFLSSDSDVDARKSNYWGNVDTTSRGSYYPAFAFAKEYATPGGFFHETHRVNGTNYKDGWYLPSVAELYALYNARETIDAAFAQCSDSNKLYRSQFWSSSQCPTADACAYTVDFSDGSINAQDKTQGYAVCPIREFD